MKLQGTNTYLCADNRNTDITMQTYDLVKRSDDYVIYDGDKPLLTAMGKEIAHDNSRLLKHILTDLLIAYPDRKVLSFELMQFQLDILEDGTDPVLENFSGFLDSDPIVRVKTGSGMNRPVDLDDISDSQFGISFWIVSELLSVVNAFFEERLSQEEFAGDQKNPFSVILEKVYKSLSPEARSGVNILASDHGSGIVLPILLVQDKISPAEYVKAVLALCDRNPDIQAMVSVQLEASSLRNYLIAAMQPVVETDSIDALIQQGEGTGIEFKSTLRWDLRQGKTSQQIERACLKSISAFLNSDGDAYYRCS